MFRQFSVDLMRLGLNGVGLPEFSLGRDGRYDLQYIPFEHVNRNAQLVIVGITPGNNQLNLAYITAQQLLRKGRPEEEILVEVKRAGAFGGKSMKPNLLKVLRHFHFEKLLGIDDVETLWGENVGLLHSTSVVPHAAFKDGERFNGSFDEIMRSPLLKQCFLECFVPSVKEISSTAVFVALGPCPQAALDWCVEERALRREQVIGSFCHPSSAGGSTTRYFLREVTKEELDPKNPVRSRCDWLDKAYEQIRSATSSLLNENVLVPVVTEFSLGRVASKAVVPTHPINSQPMKTTTHTSIAADAGITTILREVERAGYRSTNTTAKLSEFQSPGGQTIYVVKTTSQLNNINLMVHPGHRLESLRLIDGVDSVSDTHRFHSNMTKFPKRINKGKTQTAFGWQLSINTLSDLPRFLSAFKLASF